MAIGIGSGTQFSPYVHSNYYNFILQGIRGSSLDISTNEGQARMEKTIANIEKVKEQLKSAAIDFLGTEDYVGASREILNPEGSYRQIALEILKERGMRDSLINTKMQYNTSEVQTIFGERFNRKVKQILEESGEISLNKLMEIFLQDLKGRNFFTKDASSQTKMFKSLFSTDTKKVVKMEIKRKFTSEKGKITDLFKDVLKQLNKGEKTSPASNSYNYFEKRFYDKLNQKYGRNNIEIKGLTAQDYLKRIRSKIMEPGFLDVQYNDKSNAAGVLGEQWKITVIMSDVTDGLEMKLIGDIYEKDLNKIEGLEKLQQMITHHSMDKFSQTDFILIKGGKQVRVQDKNALEVYNKLFTDAGAENANMPQLAKIQDETNFLSLVERLSNTTEVGHLTDEDIEDLSYLLANEIWFRVKGSINEGMPRKISEDTGLQYGMRMANQILSNEITNFIGITVDKTFKVNPSASNIFYIFSNSVLVPTYKVLEGIINSLRDYLAKTMFYTKVTIVPSSVSSFYESDPIKFHDEKRRKTSGQQLIASMNYTDPGLLEVGGKQGRQILEQLQISRINLGVDLKTLVQSALNFKV